MRCTLLLLVLCVALFCACGSSSNASKTNVAPDASSVPTAVNEDATAQAMLLTVSDFPAGWSERPSNNDEPSPFEECAIPVSRTGHAATGDFSRGGTDRLSESISIYSTSDEIASNFGKLEGIGDCFGQVANEGKLDNNEATVSDASFSPLSFPTIGDRSVAYRFKDHVKAIGQTVLGSEFDVYLDVVSAQKGRVAFSIWGFDVLSPIDPNELETYARKAIDKIASPP